MFKRIKFIYIVSFVAVIGIVFFSFLIQKYSTVNANSNLVSNEELFLAQETLHESSASLNVSMLANVGIVDGVSTVEPTINFKKNRKLHVPIIVYHGIRATKDSDPESIRKYNTSPELLDQELSYLSQEGYITISPKDVLMFEKNPKIMPEKVVMISFDDGWRTHYTKALPLLQKYNMTATFYVYTNIIDKGSFLAWSDVADLSDAGMTIGAHTLSHPFLTKIDPMVAEKEISESKKVLEEKLGIKIEDFAYPFGDFNKTIESDVKDSGYSSARIDVSAKYTLVSDNYQLVGVDVPETFEEFKKLFE